MKIYSYSTVLNESRIQYVDAISQESSKGSAELTSERLKGEYIDCLAPVDVLRYMFTPKLVSLTPTQSKIVY